MKKVDYKDILTEKGYKEFVDRGGKLCSKKVRMTKEIRESIRRTIVSMEEIKNNSVITKEDLNLVINI